MATSPPAGLTEAVERSAKKKMQSVGAALIKIGKEHQKSGGWLILKTGKDEGDTFRNGRSKIKIRSDSKLSNIKKTISAR